MTAMTASVMIGVLVTVTLCGLVLGASSVPEIRVVSFDAYCDGKKAVNISLGPCQQHYIACNSAVGNVIGTCPRGQNFNEGRKACASLEAMNPVCYDLSVIGLTDITEQLAITTRTCDAGPGLYASFNDTCARQALLCLPNKQPQVITCPRGTYYNPNRLACVPNAIICAYPEGRANIEDALVYAYCSYRPSTKPTPAIPSDQCPSWFVDCQSHEVIVCSDGEYYDSKTRSCRIPDATNPCYRAHEDVCTGYEWRAVALGPCSAAFRYCQGRRPIVYTCADGTVFDEKTITCLHQSRVASCPKCRAGERRAIQSTGNNTEIVCKNYYECRPWQDPTWVKVPCPSGQFYDADQGRCWKNPAGACSRKPVCNERSSYRISCGDYVICKDGRYVSSSCPHLTRWDSKHRVCVPDGSCVRFQKVDESVKSCRPGDIIGRPDCRGYSVCSFEKGKFEQKSCDHTDWNYEPHTFCSTCLQTITQPKRLSAPAPPYQEEQISLCSTQTLIILPGCKSAIYCQAGTAREYICPDGTLFNATNLQCTKNARCGKPAPNSDVIIPTRISLNNPYGNGQPGFKPPPPPPLSPQQIKIYSTSGQDYCIPGRDAFRKSDPIDCGVYHECFNNIYKRRACPANSAFDPASATCKTDFKCNPVKPKCEEGKKVGLPKCGKALKCERGAWVRRKCTGNQAFVEGKCRSDVLCDVSKPPPTCVEGSIMAAPASTDCSRYLQCHGGQLYERQCSNGMKFDERYLACSLTAPCTSASSPVCYEGDIKPHQKQCNKFLTCRDGKFVEASCPLYHIWDMKAKKCIYGNCVAGRNAPATQAAPNPIVGGICVEKAGRDGFYHDPNDCRIFYQCASSKWVRKQCAPGTAWSHQLGVCDHIGNVQACRNQAHKL
uniref:Chitin-binding type-2 domain-containing protein n=1 Tax=Panagrellus redivivus TaxID=6233 RepID=A0A7E4V1H8_PANRE